MAHFIPSVRRIHLIECNSPIIGVCYTHFGLAEPFKNNMKRQNFNVDESQAAELEAARDHLHASSVKDAMLSAARLVNVLARELRSGKHLNVVDRDGQSTRLLLPELEDPGQPWLYLCARPHPWRKQFYVKGTKILASSIWNDIAANGLTLEQAALDRELPLEAIIEAISYCEQNRALINMEASEERIRMISSGIRLSA